MGTLLCYSLHIKTQITVVSDAAVHNNDQATCAWMRTMEWGEAASQTTWMKTLALQKCMHHHCAWIHEPVSQHVPINTQL